MRNANRFGRESLVCSQGETGLPGRVETGVANRHEEFATESNFVNSLKKKKKKKENERIGQRISRESVASERKRTRRMS